MLTITNQEYIVSKKNKISSSQQRSMRIQQVVLGIFGILVILSMILSLIAK